MIAALLAAEVLAVVGARLHSTAPGEKGREVTVLVEGERIRAVGEALDLPSEARVIDARGLTLIPALIDGLAYHDSEHDALYVTAGVGLIRDHGNELGRIFEARERAARGEVVGPALSISGAVLDGVPPATAAAVIVRDEHAAKDALARLAAEKVDFVSFQTNLGLEPWRALCAASRERGLQVWGPLPRAATLDDALAAGQSGVLFLDALLPAGKTWESARLEDFAASVEKVGNAHLRLVPLMRGHAHFVEDPGDSAPELGLLGPMYGEIWRRDLEHRRASLTPEVRARAEAALALQRTLLVELHRAGAVLVPGSGAPHPWMTPGRGLVLELEEWQRAGIAARELVGLATSGAAAAFDLAGERGSVAPGLVADLVLVRGDPTEDVAALHSVEAVVLRGRYFDRAALDSLRTDLAARQAAARAAAEAPIEVEALQLPEGDLLLSGRVETMSPAGRASAERWAIVREVDGVLTFCGRRIVPGGAARGDLAVELRQRVKSLKLESFDIRVLSGGRELAVRGLFTAEQWRIERRADGAFVDNRAARERIAAVDVGSVTTFMLLAHTRAAGPFPVLRFDEGLELEVVRWDLSLDDNGDHAFRTPQGLKFAGFEENGALKAVVEQRGQAALQTTSVELDAHDGPGLPLPADKLERMRRGK